MDSVGTVIWAGLRAIPIHELALAPISLGPAWEVSVILAKARVTGSGH